MRLRLKAMPTPQTVEAFVEIVAQTVRELRQGKCDSRTANAVAQLASVFTRAREISNLEKRIAVIEAHDAAMRRR